MEYELHDLADNTKHSLEFENIADIQCCLDIVARIKAADGNHKRITNIVKGIPGINCLSETIQKMSKVSIPVTDY